jgi:acyl carrier protein phosphodiesterase
LNYLAHIALSGSNSQHRVGGLLGDFVRGPLRGEYPAAIEVGIDAHRQLDAYVDRQPEMQRFVRRFDRPMRRYAGIVADIFYDHLLATNWLRYYPQSLDEFCQSFYGELSRHRDVLPSRAQAFANQAPKVRWLQNYSDESNLPLILSRVGSRFKKPLALQDALPTVAEYRAEISSDFHRLYPRLQSFMQGTLDQTNLDSAG